MSDYAEIWGRLDPHLKTLLRANWGLMGPPPNGPDAAADLERAGVELSMSSRSDLPGPWSLSAEFRNWIRENHGNAVISTPSGDAIYSGDVSEAHQKLAPGTYDAETIDGCIVSNRRVVVTADASRWEQAGRGPDGWVGQG